MTLPFRKSQPKKFRCFVCGVDYTSYEEFREHIIEKHEEGREYIVCKQCGAPVRDVRLHYKVKHPGRKLPKDGQMRAMIWYDFSGQKRKRNKKKPPFKEGYLISPKNHGKEMHYRSGYELEVYQLLEEHNKVARYEVEPTDCVTPYFWDGRWRKYFPDIKVVFTNGIVEIWEVKPSNQTDLQQNQIKWDACAKYVGRKGMAFDVYTEQRINQLRRVVLEQKKSPSSTEDGD